MQEVIDELIRHYFIDAVYEIESVPFGLTNTTKIIRIYGDKYVVRIYNSHTKHIAGLELESKITSFLSKQNLTFQVPVFLRTQAGEDYVQLSNGMLGAIVSFVEGDVPSLMDIKQADDYGRVVGELSYALSSYEGQLEYAGKAFSEIYAIHPLADHQAVMSFMVDPPFYISETNSAFYQEMLASLASNIPRLAELPKQLVHHDVLIFNLLAQENKICGVLDFDLTSFDVSFMEFAICLNHVLQISGGSVELAEGFVRGYAEFRTCSRQEIEQLHVLTQVYHLAVLHFYIGQHYAGNVIEQNFTYILNQFYTRQHWLAQNSEHIQALLQTYLLEEK